jgi:phosphoribosyl-ATP pyrophosphohydrolase/phosphoribosyl-AMP cyclohydrolase
MKLDFQKSADGLLPAIIQHARTGEVLMLGYMNETALQKTLDGRQVTFFSRSKNRLWTKGETSGHFLDVVEVLPDCDNDALLIKALPNGPVCHTGTSSCFGENAGAVSILGSLEATIADRFDHPKDGSYVSSLVAKGINKIAQKVGEEAVELVIEAKDDRPDLFLNEAADLLFHTLILLRSKGFSLKEVESVLEKRMK